MSKYFYLKGHKVKDVFKWRKDGYVYNVYQVFKDGKEEWCSNYCPTEYHENVKSGDWIPCTKEGYKLSYTMRELEGKVLKAHKDGFTGSVEGIGRRFCVRNRLYPIEKVCGANNVVLLESYNTPLENLGQYFYPVNKPKGKKRPSENWIQKISESKFHRCIKSCVRLEGFSSKIFYNPSTNCCYKDEEGEYTSYNLNKIPEKSKNLLFLVESSYQGRRFPLKNVNKEFEKEEGMDKEQPVRSEWTDKHYNFNYQLTEDDIEKGFIKLDPYFVGKQWKIGSKDDSGVLVHQLKTIARFGDKNPVEREIRALYAQVKRMVEIYNVDVEDK